MWEQIRSNKRRSFLLIAALGALLILLGFLIGAAFSYARGGLVGVVIGGIIWFVLWLTAISRGREILLGSANAREVRAGEAPRLSNVVQEMTIAAGLPKPPKVYVIDCDAPNAFAVGTPDDAAVAVTTGLLMYLNRDELQGVISHEVGHIKNHDTSFMTQAGVMVAAIVIIADLFLRATRTMGAGQRRSGGRRGGGGAAVFLLLALVFAILAPFLAQLLYFACSRRREYLADACSAQFTRYPEGLASALEKISQDISKMPNVNRATAPMYIVNPLRGSEASSVFATHPPVRERIRILRSMAGGAAYADYEAAYRRSRNERLMQQATLSEVAATPIRAPSAEPEAAPLAKAREAVDIVHRLEGYLFLACPCGIRIKVPPTFREHEIHCPACGRGLAIPVAATTAALLAAAGLQDEEAPKPQAGPPLTFAYTPGQWQSFRCECGKTIQLSPVFVGSRVQCPACHRLTTIVRK